MRTLSRLARGAALALGAALVAVPVGVQPASAATCAPGSGVSVVVDPNSLGGSVATSCVADGGGDTASSLFAAAGHALTYAQRQPGFVCRVDGAPADDPCVNASPADRFWSLWWSDGESGTWTYSTQGVTALKIPEGGSVAFSFDDVDGEARPSATPQGSAPSATPTAGTGGSGAGGGSGGSSGSTGSGASEGGSSSAAGSTTSPSPTAGAGAPSGEGRERDRGSDDAEERKGRDRRTDGAGGTETSDQPSEAASEEAVADDVASDPDAAPASAETDGLPVWVAPVALLVLALGAGGAVLARRRSLR